MDTKKFDAAISELRRLIVAGEIVFPPLKPDSTGRGTSTITKITEDTIYFRRGKATFSVKIEDLRNAYVNVVCKSHSTTPHTPIPLSDLDKYFQYVFVITFFLQLLKYFGLAEITGSGFVKLTKADMERLVNDFMEIYRNDENSRFRSYDHAHKVFVDYFGTKKPKNLDYVALHLFAFLGSWGMLCRSSFLLQKDYRFLIPVVKILYNPNYKDLLSLDPLSNDFDRDKFLCLVLKAVNKLREYFIGKTYYRINPEPDCNVQNVTNTEIGKILMVTFGCLPAYDTYVVRGMKEEGLCATLGEKSINQLIDYCKVNQTTLTKISASIEKYTKMKYPVMKILDMIFWEYGLELEEKK